MFHILKVIGDNLMKTTTFNYESNGDLVDNIKSKKIALLIDLDIYRPLRDMDVQWTDTDYK